MQSISTHYMLLVVILILLGIFGGMDYLDAQATARAENENTIRLACQSIADSDLSRPRSVTYQFVVNGINDIDHDAVDTVFSCTVIDESGDGNE